MGLAVIVGSLLGVRLDAYTSETSRFTGTVRWVQIDIDDAAEDLNHLITTLARH